VSRYFDKFRKEHAVSTHSHTHTKSEGLLVNLAESIGSTLGTLAAKADAAQKVLTGNGLAAKTEKQVKNVVRKAKTAAGRARKTLKRATRRRSAKRAVGRRTRSSKARK
jgi:hypothetical protein